VLQRRLGGALAAARALRSRRALHGGGPLRPGKPAPSTTLKYHTQDLPRRPRPGCSSEPPPASQGKRCVVAPARALRATAARGWGATSPPLQPPQNSAHADVRRAAYFCTSSRAYLTRWLHRSRSERVERPDYGGGDSTLSVASYVGRWGERGHAHAAAGQPRRGVDRIHRCMRCFACDCPCGKTGVCEARWSAVGPMVKSERASERATGGSTTTMTTSSARNNTRAGTRHACSTRHPLLPPTPRGYCCWNAGESAVLAAARGALQHTVRRWWRGNGGGQRRRRADAVGRCRAELFKPAHEGAPRFKVVMDLGFLVTKKKKTTSQLSALATLSYALLQVGLNLAQSINQSIFNTYIEAYGVSIGEVNSRSKVSFALMTFVPCRQRWSDSNGDQSTRPFLVDRCGDWQ
jgi:hypothetical protein